jgi:predicted HicB family RNase H-like nuclease
MARAQAGKTTRRQRSQREASYQSYVEVVGTGERIPVPDDPAGERAAVVAHPIYQRRRTQALWESAEGRTTSFDELRRQMDAEEEAERGTRRKPTGPRPGTANGKVLLRLPLSIHQEPIAQAERDQTSLNQLVLAYISRGLGQDSKSA